MAPLGGGLTAVYRYDTSGLRMDPPGWGMRQKLLAPEPRPMDDAGASVEGTDTGDVIDLMVVYTPAAAALGNIDAFIQFALNNTQEAYRNSNIEFRLRLVHKAQVDYTQHEEFMGEDLRHLDNPNDGYMDEVHGLRDRYGADLVALFVAGPEGGLGTCGVAWVPDYGKNPTTNYDTWAFSVTGQALRVHQLPRLRARAGPQPGSDARTRTTRGVWTGRTRASTTGTSPGASDAATPSRDGAR